jgi:hypothetical protein
MYLRKVGWEDMDWIHEGNVRAGRLIHKGCSPPRNFVRNCTKYLNERFH